MKPSAIVLRVAAVALFASLFTVTLLAQQDNAPQQSPPTQNDRADRGNRSRRQFDPAQREEFMKRMRERMDERLKEQLKASDDEWSVIQPRLDKVMEMRMSGMMGGMRFAFRGPRGGDQADSADRPAPPAPTGPGADVVLAERSLNEVVSNDKATPDEIKAAMQKLRDARTKQEADLKAARTSLREVLTLRQEATLVTMGILD